MAQSEIRPLRARRGVSAPPSPARDRGVNDTTIDLRSFLNEDSPPDYVERPCTPFPGAPPPTSEDYGIRDSLEERHGRGRSDSDFSYTSRRLHHPTRVGQSQAHKSDNQQPSTIHRAKQLLAIRGLKRGRSSSDDSLASKISPKLQENREPINLPAPVHLPAGNSRNEDAEGVDSSDSIGFLSVTPKYGSASSREPRNKRNGPPHGPGPFHLGKISASIGSFFSTNTEHERTPFRGSEISGPFNFKHEAGSGWGPLGDPTKSETRSTLIDLRSEHRIEHNHTALPIRMPPVVSPINMAEFDAGCGHNSPPPEHRNRFGSPESPAVTVSQIQAMHVSHAPAKSCFTSLSSRMHFPGSGNKERLLYWIFAVCAQLALLSIVASLTTLGVRSTVGANANDSGILAWLIVSITAFVLGSLCCGIMWIRRTSHKLTRQLKHHHRSRRDEEWIEMENRQTLQNHSNMPSNHVPSLDDELAHRQVLAQASREAQDKAWEKFMSNPVRLREYVERLETQATGGNAGASASSSRQNGSSSHPGNSTPNLARPSMSQMVQPMPSAMIGIARSESLVMDEQRGRPATRSGTPGSTNTRATYESVSTDKPIMSKSKANQSSYDSDGSSSTMTAEKIAASFSGKPMATEKKPVNVPKPAPGTHTMTRSNAMADLHSDPRIAMASVPSNGTIDSLLTSYASTESEGVKPYSPLDKNPEALRSHPTNLNHFTRRQIVTESGTPDSQKSEDRCGASTSTSNRHWESRNANASRHAAMTPIEERSEVASAYSGSHC